MIDIHCHILPDFDDGSTCLEESLDMARMAVATGVEGIVATPHFPGEPVSVWQMKPLMERFRLLQDALAEENIPLKLYPGAEILCLPETPEMAEKRALPTIGDTDYLLTEFDFGESGRFMTQMLEMLIYNGYRPVIAHPERYDAVQHNPMLCRHWAENLGCVLQMNKGSLLGAFGGRTQYAARYLLDVGLVHLIASDAHGAAHRTPHMERLRRWLEEHYSPEYVRVLLEQNPARLLGNRRLSLLRYDYASDYR